MSKASTVENIRVVGLCSDSIHCVRKGLLQSVAVELYNPQRNPHLTLITVEDRPRINPLALQFMCSVASAKNVEGVEICHNKILTTWSIRR